MESEPNQNRTQQIVYELKQRVLDQRGIPGEFFATEEQLSKEFNVSRVIMREAIGRLRGLGILVSKKNVGLTFGRVDPMELFETGLTFFSSNNLEVSHLLQIRFIIEVGALEFAVRNATPQKLEQMEALADECKELIKSRDTSGRVNEVDMMFHEMFLEMTGNKLLQRMHNTITKYYIQKAEEMNRLNHRHQNRELSQIELGLNEHNEIVDAIRAHDIELAKSILIVHLRRSLKFLEETLVLD